MSSLIAKSQFLTSRPWSKKLFSLSNFLFFKNADHLVGQRFIGTKASAVDEESKQCLINETASGWGVKFIRNEIKDTTSLPGELQAREMQVEAERRKHSEIFEAEGEKELNIKASKENKESEILAERRTRIFPFDEKDLESKETLWRLYEKWQRYHNVTRDLDKNHERFYAFMKNAKFVHESNKTYVTMILSLNKFADLTEEERLRMSSGTRTRLTEIKVKKSSIRP